MDRLSDLEAQSVFIFREAFARLKRLALLWSLGKDSNVMIWLARKAFFGRVPFPVMHISEKTDLFGFDYEDFRLEGYQAHPHIKAEVAV